MPPASYQPDLRYCHEDEVGHQWSEAARTRQRRVLQATETQQAKQTEGEIFDTEKAEYSVSAERREDQIAVDKQVVDVIKQHPDKKFMFGFLASLFSLTNKQYPHKMVF